MESARPPFCRALALPLRALPLTHHPPASPAAVSVGIAGSIIALLSTVVFMRAVSATHGKPRCAKRMPVGRHLSRGGGGHLSARTTHPAHTLLSLASRVQVLKENRGNDELQRLSGLIQ